MKSPRLKVTRVVARIWRKSTALVAALVLLGSLTSTSLARAQEPGSSPSESTPIVEIPEACVPAPSQDRVGPAGAEVPEPAAEPTIDVAPSPQPSASPEFTAEPDPEPSASAAATPEPDPTATEISFGTGFCNC